MAKLIKVKSGKAFVSLRALVKGSEDTPAPSPSIPSEEFEELKSKVTENTSKIAQVENSTNGAIANVDDKIDAAEQRISNNETNVAELTAVVSQNKETIENEIAVVRTAVTDLEDSIDNKIDIKVAGAFRFRGSKESLEQLNAIEDADRHEGDVWQVGEKEYAYNGTEFVELGFAIDLSAYATAESVANVAEQVASKASAERVAEVAAAVETKANKVEVDAALNEKATKTELADKISEVNTLLDGKVDSVEGKQLSDQNFTSEEKQKLAGLSNFDPSELESEIANKSDSDHNHDNVYVKKEDAFSGDYNDLSNKPEIPESVDLSGIENRVTELETTSAKGTELQSVKDELTESIATKADSSTVAELESTIASLREEIVLLRQYVNALHNTPDAPIDENQVQASVESTPYEVTKTEENEQVVINLPLTNTVTVTAPAVTIANNITASEENYRGILVTADSVNVGE